MAANKAVNIGADGFILQVRHRAPDRRFAPTQTFSPRAAPFAPRPSSSMAAAPAGDPGRREPAPSTAFDAFWPGLSAQARARELGLRLILFGTGPHGGSRWPS